MGAISLRHGILDYKRIGGGGAPTPVPVPTDYKACYKFENDLTDETGNYNGVPTDLIYGNDGRQYADFNGTSSKIFVNSNIGISTTFTISFWINYDCTNQNTPYPDLVQTDPSGEVRYGIRLNHLSTNNFNVWSGIDRIFSSFDFPAKNFSLS